MTSASDSVGKTLLGERPASIRRVTDSLEIETKTGRVVHVTRTTDGQCVMAQGPAPDTAPPADQRSRTRVDLTTKIPFAFDNRPTVTSVEFLQHGATRYGCVIGFSGGGQVAYQLDHGQPQLAYTPPTAANAHANATQPATAPPKYSLPEIERRWRVAPDAADALLVEHPAIIRDKYLADTHLRLRSITATNREAIFKLCKKYGNKTGATQAITNLYLSAAEHRLIDELPGTVVTKARHPQPPGSIDVYTGSSGDLFVFEVEFSTINAAANFHPPEFVAGEITEDTQMSGYALAARYGE
ncbi:MAG: hypothetical protein OES38_17185 [Gammaproteobacteria bacterium]|nr:hypothetical protein [Gammaproteobacteria bacterium]